MAARAGHRLSNGDKVQLRSRSYTRGSRVTEEDARESLLKCVLFIVIILLGAADILVELGSGSKDIAAGNLVTSGFETANERHPMEVLKSKTGVSLPTIRTESFNIVKYTIKYYSTH